MRAVAEAAGSGVPVLGVCNGFQVLTEAGLLPGALMRNAGLPFVCRPVGLTRREQPVDLHQRLCRGRGDHASRSPTTTAITRPMPTTLDRLEGEGRVAFRYTERGQRLGATASPGILNDAGNVLGHDAAPRARVRAGARQPGRPTPVRRPARSGRLSCCSPLKRRAPGIRPPWLPRINAGGRSALRRFAPGHKPCELRARSSAG